jgi:hypothetical protein
MPRGRWANISNPEARAPCEEGRSRSLNQEEVEGKEEGEEEEGRAS